MTPFYGCGSIRGGSLLFNTKLPVWFTNKKLNFSEGNTKKIEIVKAVYSLNLTKSHWWLHLRMSYFPL